jgi:hypothetical protein
MPNNVLQGWKQIFLQPGSHYIKKISSLHLNFDISCVFQKCLMKNKLCITTFSSIVTVSGSCNMFGVCRSGGRAQLNHPACKSSSKQYGSVRFLRKWKFAPGILAQIFIFIFHWSKAILIQDRLWCFCFDLSLIELSKYQRQLAKFISVFP